MFDDKHELWGHTFWKSLFSASQVLKKATFLAAYGYLYQNQLSIKCSFVFLFRLMLQRAETWKGIYVSIDVSPYKFGQIPNETRFPRNPGCDDLWIDPRTQQSQDAPEVSQGSFQTNLRSRDTLLKKTDMEFDFLSPGKVYRIIILKKVWW